MPKRTYEEEQLYKKYKKYISSKEFEEIRNAVFDRDGHRCVCCGWDPTQGGKRSLQAHHCTYENLFNEMNNLSDLICICSVCHKAIHSAISNYHRFRMKVKEDDK